MAAGSRRFENLKVWQSGRILCGGVYRLTGQGSLGRDFALRDQMRSASISIISNIAEGCDRGTDPQFIQFLRNAKGSCAELRAQLYIVEDCHDVPSVEVESLISSAEEVSRMLEGLIQSLDKKQTNK